MIPFRSLVVVGLMALCLMVAGQTEAASIVGVAFSSSSSGPTNWTVVTSGGTATTATINHLIDETGNPTSLSLSFSAPSGSYFSGVALNASTVPIHTPSLAFSGNIDTSGTAGLTFSAQWSGLVANSLYDIWVFGTRYQASLNQTVTITGAGAFYSFVQSGTATQLIVNGSVGSSANTLQSYADPILSSATGTITITATGVVGGYGVDGLAIEQAVPEPTSLVLLGLGIGALAVWRGIVPIRKIPT
jgi:PEP-CTERM motif